MRKPVMAALIVAVAVLLGSTVMLYQQNQRTTATLTETQQAEATTRSNYADAFNAIAEIQDSLNAISVKDRDVKLVEQREQRLTQPDRAQVLASISQLNASIQRTKDRIGELETRLGKSGVQVASLKKMLANQKRQLAEKEGQVAALTVRVDSLQTQVAGLETTVHQAQETIVAKDQTIEEKQRELGTIYYIVGSKKDLSESGVIVAKGGVLGLGKTLQLSGHFDESRFTSLNTDQETIVRAPVSKVEKVKVLSAQPVGSYEIRQDGDQVEIHIIDPVEFRKVKHLVIVTA